MPSACIGRGARAQRGPLFIVNQEVEMRIAFVADPDSPGGWYRGIGPMIALARRGHEVRQLHDVDGTFHDRLLPGCDVLHIYRWHDEHALRMVKLARQWGIAVIW